MHTNQRLDPESTNTSNHPQRRTLLHGIAALPAFAALAHTLAPTAGRADEVVAHEDLLGFLKEWALTVQALVDAERVEEDRHLQRLCAELAHFEASAYPTRTRDAYAKDGLTTGPVFGAPHFEVVELELAPNRVVAAHNHVGYAFLSMGVEGEATVRHFEPEGRAADPETEERQDFSVRETTRRVLTPGRSTTLSRTRENVHGFVAGPNGARLLEFGVKFPDPGKGPRTFSILDVDAQPQDPERHTFTARWIGNIYAKK